MNSVTAVGRSSRLRVTPVPCWSVPVTTTVLKAFELSLLLLLITVVTATAVSLWGAAWKPGQAVWLVILLSSIVAFESLRMSGAYRWRRLTTGHGQWRRTALAALLATTAASASFAELGAPLAAILGLGGLIMVSVSVTLSVVRAGVTYVLRGWLGQGRFATKIAVVGSGPAAEAMARRLRALPVGRVRMAGRYSTDDQPGTVTDLRGNLETLALDCKLRRLDAVVLAESWAASDVLVERLSAYAQDFYTMADPIEGSGPGRPTRLAGEALVLLWERPLKDWQGLRKAAFDRVAATMILVAVAPLLAVVALLVRLESPGPVLFRQFRVGFNNQLFSIYKFRTMQHAAADRLASQQTVPGDVRVTRVGAVLRQLSIDELPQLINILCGEMSLVGPRPHAPGTSAEGKPVHALVPHYARRHLVRPGITGLAQVRGLRGGMHTMQQVVDRLEADLEYIRSQSLRLDLEIMVMTLMRELRSKRAF